MARPVDWLRHESDSHIGQRDGLDQLLNPDPIPPAPDFTRFGEDPTWLAGTPALGAPPLMDFDAPLSMSGGPPPPAGSHGADAPHGQGEVALGEPAAADAAPLDFGAHAQGLAFATAPLGSASGHGAAAGGGADIFAFDRSATTGALSAHFHEGFTTGYLQASDQSDQALNADAARAAWHLDGSTVAGTGTPIKIGILSDSFNLLGGAASDIANGDLPSSFSVASNVLEEGPAGGNDEGRAMAELIHRIAPGAQLYFHTAFNGQADFAAGIEQLQAAGCQIIVDDVTYFDEPFFQDNTSLSSIQGAVHDVVALGSSYFTAASNEGKAFYGSAFNAESISLPSIGSVVANNFGGGSPFQNVTIPRGEVVDFVLQWDQPFASIGTGHSSQNSLALLLYDSTGTRLLLNENVNAVGGDPVQINEFANNTSQTSFKVAIIDNGGAAAGQFKYIAYTDDNGVAISGGGTGSGSLIGHEMNIDANTVGAAYWGDTPRFGTNPPPGGELLLDGPGRVPVRRQRQPPVLAGPDL
jgi:hypothetical protein